MDIFGHLKGKTKGECKTNEISLYFREDSNRNMQLHSVNGGKIDASEKENIDGLEQQNEPKIQVAKAEIALTGE